jgi:hypothetical protein
MVSPPKTILVPSRDDTGEEARCFLTVSEYETHSHRYIQPLKCSISNAVFSCVLLKTLLAPNQYRIFVRVLCIMLCNVTAAVYI